MIILILGECTYVLTTNRCPQNPSTSQPAADETAFEIIVENVACNSEGFSCTKSVSFRYAGQVCLTLTPTQRVTQNEVNYDVIILFRLYTWLRALSPYRLVTPEVTS